MTEEKPKIERTLTKIDDNTFKLTIQDKKNQLMNEKIHTRKQLRQIYKDILVPNSKGVQATISHTITEIKKLDVEDTPELREFIETMKKADKLLKKQQLEAQLKKQKQDQEQIRLEMHEIEHAVPEVLRKKR